MKKKTTLCVLVTHFFKRGRFLEFSNSENSVPASR